MPAPLIFPSLPLLAVTASYEQLSYWQVAAAAALILIGGVISAAVGLGIGRSLLVAGIRTVVQLLLVGIVLQWVFRSIAGIL